MSILSRNYSIRTPLLLLATGEFLAALLSVLGASILLFGSVSAGEDVMGPLNLKATVVATMLMVSLISMGLYHFHQRLYFPEILLRVTVGVSIGAVGLAAIYVVFPSVSLPREFVAVSILLSLAIVLLVRFYFFQNLDTNVFRRRTLIFGAGERAGGITSLRRRADRRGFEIVGSIPADGDLEVSLGNGKLISDRPLLLLTQELAIDEIVIAMDNRRGNLPVRDLLDCKLAGVNVIDILEFLERESEKIRIDLVNPSSLIFSPGFRTTRLRKIGKRLFDFLLSASALLVVWPVLILIAIAIKIESGLRSPIFYRQIRVGQFGINFPILKFRSMREDAESETGAVWAEENDPRTTRIGRFIRKTRLDELPQIINVLRGEMSIVGPRPERPEFVEKLAESIPYYLERHSVKPGITGWAQLRYSYGSTEEDAIEKLQYDLYYIKNHRMSLDVLIILQTVEVVMWKKGAR